MPLPLAAIYGLTALGTAVFGTAGYQTLKNLRSYRRENRVTCRRWDVI